MAKGTIAEAPLSDLARHKLPDSSDIRRAANRTMDALRVGTGSMYEAAAALGSFQGKYPVRQQDLLIAFPSDEAHLPLVQAGRQWHNVRHRHTSKQTCAVDTSTTSSAGVLTVQSSHIDTSTALRSVHTDNTGTIQPASIPMSCSYTAESISCEE